MVDKNDNDAREDNQSGRNENNVTVGYGLQISERTKKARPASRAEIKKRRSGIVSISELRNRKVERMR